jgi:hypothetical protein
MLTLLVQYKTYVAAVGLVGLAVYQASNGDLQTAATTFLGALVAAGLRHETAPGAPTVATPASPSTAPLSPAPPRASSFLEDTGEYHGKR